MYTHGTSTGKRCPDCAPQWPLRFSVCSCQDERVSVPASTCSRRTRSVGLGKPASATAGVQGGATDVTRPSKRFLLSDSTDDERTFPVAADGRNKRIPLGKCVKYNGHLSNRSHAFYPTVCLRALSQDVFCEQVWAGATLVSDRHGPLRRCISAKD